MTNRIACVRACVFLALVASILSISCGVALAQFATLDVTGRVTANDGTPIAGATVVLAERGTSQSGRTDARGEFIIKSLRPGTYALHAGAPGYQPVSQRTVTIDSTNSNLAIVLSPATTSSLTVIGQVRANAGETVSTASAPSVTLSAQNAAAAGVTAVSSMVWPQLSVTPILPLGGGSNATELFAVRGPDPTETLVDIDGHQVNNGNTGDFDLSLLDPAALQEVQVLYGIAPSSLIGPNQIGGGINIVSLQPTISPHSLLRIFGGSYGTYGETIQTTGTADRLGYAVSLHATSSQGSVNQTIFAPPPGGANNESLQQVGSGSWGDSILTKLRYQLGGDNGYGYLQVNFRNQTVAKDESALLSNYTPPGFSGGGDDARFNGSVTPLDDGGGGASSGYQSFAGTWLGEHQSNYGFDAQTPIGNQILDGAPATIFQFSYMNSLWNQSVGGPGAQTQQYLYNQRDLISDGWLEIDHHFGNGLLSFKYDLENESLTTNYVQGQVVAEADPNWWAIWSYERCPLNRPICVVRCESATDTNAGSRSDGAVRGPPLQRRPLESHSLFACGLRQLVQYVGT